MKRILILFFSFLLTFGTSIVHADETSGPLVVQEPWQATGQVGSMIAQAGQPQPQTVPQTTQPQAPTQTPSTPIPTRIQRVEQVREQQERLRQMSGQGTNATQVETTGTAGAAGTTGTTGTAGATGATSAVGTAGAAGAAATAGTVRSTSRASGMISLNFDDADVYSVAQTIFGEILRVNYIIDQQVKGRVTFRSIAPVATDQVLPLMEVILRLNGIGVVEEGSLYRIVPIGNVAKEPAQVSMGRDPDKVPLQGKSIIHVIPISYGSSTDMIKLITPFLTTSAIAIDVPTMNHIIIVDTDANVRRILSLIKVFDSEETRAKKPQVYVYHVQNSKAKDIATILQQAFATTAVVMPASTTSTVTTGTSSSTPSSPMLPQSQPPRTATTPSSGPQSASSAASGGSSLVSSMTKIIADENLNLLVILALPEDYELMKEAIKRIDIIPRQVVIEGLIAEVSLRDDLSLGISWALQYNPSVFKGFVGKTIGSMGFNVVNSSGTGLVTPQTTAPTTFGTPGQFSVLATVNDNFTAAINMLASESRAKLLAVPRILVSDNKEARIQVGQQIPITTSESYTTSTSTVYNTVQYKDIGIILKVKPRINEGGLVSLDISQEISSFSVEQITGSNEGIVVSKTEAMTSLVVQNGQTIVIGGLIREDVSDGRAGIPFLSKIPILGYLFGNTDKTNHRNELIILLTPRVITNQAEAQAVTSGYVDTITQTGKGKITREELLREPAKAPDKSVPENLPAGPNGNKNGSEKKEP